MHLLSSLKENNQKIRRALPAAMIAVVLGIVGTVLWEYFVKPAIEQYQAKRSSLTQLTQLALNDQSVYVRAAATKAVAHLKTDIARAALLEIANSRKELAPLIADISARENFEEKSSLFLSSAVLAATTRSDLIEYEKTARAVRAYKMLLNQVRTIKTEITRPGNLTPAEQRNIEALGLVKAYDDAIDSINSNILELNGKQESYVARLVAAKRFLDSIKAEHQKKVNDKDMLGLESLILETVENLYPAFDNAFGDPQYVNQIEIEGFASMIRMLPATVLNSQAILTAITQKTESPPTFRSSAVTAMGLGRDEAFLPALLKLLKDSDPQVRAEAAIAIARITGKKDAKLPDGGRFDFKFPTAVEGATSRRNEVARAVNQ